MAKFKVLSRLARHVGRQGPRSFGIVCENHPNCGSDVMGYWEPHMSIDIADPKVLKLEMERQHTKFVHHCPKCHEQYLAAQPPEQRGGLDREFHRRMQEINEQYWRKHRTA